MQQDGPNQILTNSAEIDLVMTALQYVGEEEAASGLAENITQPEEIKFSNRPDLLELQRKLEALRLRLGIEDDKQMAMFIQNVISYGENFIAENLAQEALSDSEYEPVLGLNPEAAKECAKAIKELLGSGELTDPRVKELAVLMLRQMKSFSQYHIDCVLTACGISS